MRRLALACLLTLTACQRPDPEGTIQPDEAGRTSSVPLGNGDSPPFRLEGGDMTLTIFPASDTPSVDSMAACGPVFTLIPYGESEGRAINTAATLISVTRVNAIKAGVYFIRARATQPYCKYTLFASPAK